MRTELPKIGPGGGLPLNMAAPAPLPDKGPSSPQAAKESNHLLNKVAAAMPLLPPLAASAENLARLAIDQTKKQTAPLTTSGLL